MYSRHMAEYGTTQEQLANISVNQRFNALENENAVFRGQPLTIDDVLNSRYINYPIRLLESVMPCAGGSAIILTSAERAKSLKNKPVYILGAGIACDPLSGWQRERLTRSVVTRSAPIALGMAGYGPSDIQFAQFYDCYTILHAVCLEDAGLVPEGRHRPVLRLNGHHLQGRVSDQHGRRPTLMRTTRRRRRIPPRNRGNAADHGARRRKTS